MTQHTHTPTKALTMSIDDWRLRLAELCRDCAMAESDEEGDYLRLAHALLSQAPDGDGDGDGDGGPDFGAVLAHLPPLARVETLVEQGAMDSVALALLPEEASYLMSRSVDGVWLASVYLPGMDEEMSSEGDSLAMALTSALLASLAHVSQGPQADFPMENEAWARAVDALGDSIWQRPAGTLLN